MKRLFFAIAICMLVSSTAFAGIYGTTTVTTVETLGLTVQVEISGGHQSSLFAGLRTLTAQSSSLIGLPADAYFQGDGTYLAFCTDLYDATINGLVYDIEPLDKTPDPPASAVGGMGPVKAGLVAGLLSNNSYTTQLDAAAMQVAIWEIIDEENASVLPWSGTSHENNTLWDASTGDFFLTSGVGNNDTVITAANLMLGSLVSSDFSRYTALSFGNDGNPFKWGQGQDFVVVPVPASLLICMLGVGIAGIKLRKFA